MSSESKIHPARFAIYGKHDPYGVTEKLETDLQGWGGNNPLLGQLYEASKGEGLAADVGTWKGQSAANVGHIAKRRGHPAHVVAVDTFLGSTEHWERTPDILQLYGGRPRLYELFMSNMVNEGLADYVTPCPLPANQAAELLRRKGILFDYIYVDANHDYDDVKADIANWWPLLRVGGIMAGDDYSPAAFPGVVRAVDEAFPGAQKSAVTWFVRRTA